MDKLKADLIAQINDAIKANGIGEITGPIMNAQLNSMVTTLHGVHFQHPVHSGVDPLTDIGKLMMYDPDTGTAKVYQLSEAKALQKGKWTIKIITTNSNDFASLVVRTKDNGVYMSRNEWNADWSKQNYPQNNGVVYPTDAATELANMRDYIQLQGFTDYTFTISGNEMTIEETIYKGTSFAINNDSLMTCTIVQESRPALPPAPTNYPLGKLVGVTENGMAMISCAPIDTFSLAGSVNVVKDLFSYEKFLQPNTETGLNVLSNMMFPFTDGKLSSFNIDTIDPEVDFLQQVNHHFFGWAISSTATTVTVINLSHYSLFASVLIRLSRLNKINNRKVKM